MMKTLKNLLILTLLAIVALSVNAQLSDSDLLISELYNGDFPTDDGTISLVDGVSGDYQLLNYSILGDLDAEEGRDGIAILVKHSEEGTDYYLYAILSESSFPRPAAYTLLGHDIVLLDFNINEGQITVDFAAENEDEVMMPMRKSFLLEGDTLTIIFEGQIPYRHPFFGDDTLTVEELSNVTYPLDWFDFPLVMFEGVSSFVVGTSEASSEFIYRLDTEHIAYGDLNGDGAEDAVVYIAWGVEGYEGESAIIAAVFNHQGYPQVIDAYVDRQGSAARLEELAIKEDGSITFHYTDLVHQQLLEYSFVLEDGELRFE